MCTSFPDAAGQRSSQMESLQIDGPREVTTGSLIRLSAKTDEKETAFWIVLKPIELDFEVVDGGQRILFSSGCKPDVQITLLLLAQQVHEGRIVTRQIRRTIQVVADRREEPADEPPNTVPDDPSLSDSPLYLKVKEAWKSIRTDAAKELSVQVASNIENMATKCESGQIQEASDIWRELAKSNRKTLGIESSAWEPVASVLQVEFQGLDLPTPFEHAFHLKATAAAIRDAAELNRDQESEK